MARIVPSATLTRLAYTLHTEQYPAGAAAAAYFPHVSLVYSSMPANEREDTARWCREEIALPRRMAVRRVQEWQTEGSDVASWRMTREFCLLPSQASVST